MEYNGPLKKHGLRCTNTPGCGAKLSPANGISSIIAVPPNCTLYETSAHVGVNANLEYPKDIKDEILLACQNVEDYLKTADVEDGWKAVYRMTTYHLGNLTDCEEGLEAALQKYLGDNRPAWAGVGVAALLKP